MTDNNTKIDELIDILAKDGKSQEEVGMIVTKISQMVVARIYNELLLSLNEQQQKIVDQEEDDTEAEAMMTGFYLKNTGDDIEETRDKVENSLITEFINSYQKQKNNK